MLALTLAVPAFALEESDVEAAVSSSSREAVTGNVLVWFLCAVGFLKVSQKIDSFMASIGVNVGHTGGSMLGEAMVAFKGVSLAAGMAGKVVGNFADRASSRAGAAASGSSGFLQGGLAGVVSRKITNDAVRTATQTTQKASSSTMSAAHQATERTVNAERQASSVVHQAKQTRSESASQKSQTGVTHQQVTASTRTASVSSLHRESQHSVGLGGRIFTNSMLEGGRFANDVIGMVAAGDLHSTGSITGEFASQAMSSYVCEEISAPDGYVITDAAETVYLSGKDQDVITVTFGNDKMGSLLIVKKDAVTGTPISDVEFFVTDSDGSVIGTANGKYVTDSAGTIRIDGLTPGMTVIAKEVRAKDGYILDDTPQSIKIKRNSVMTLEFRNQPKGGVLVKKVDAVTNAPISDVEFLVTDSDGNLIGNANGKFVTDSAGTFTITDIAPGTTLVIKETRAKVGYILDDTPQTVKVKSNEVVTVEFRNQPKGNLIIVKQDSVTKEPLEGVQFKIVYADGSYVDAEGGTLSSTGLYWTDKEGKITLSGISGTVVVTEVETIPGYTIDENTRTQTVVINPNDTQTLHFYNDPVGGVEIIKVNEDNHSERIPNTTFEIRKVDDALVDTVTTDKNGRVFVALEDGSYYAKEVTSNKSFRLDDTPHYFEIKDGKRVTLQVTNKKLSGIVIHKIDSATGEGIYGVKFVLYDANKKPIGEYTSDDEGYIYIDEIPGGLSGRFYLRELEAAPGYTLDKQYKTVYVSPGKTVEIEWENTAVTGQIQIYKYAAEYNEVTGTAAGTPLKGAVYEIVNVRSGKVVDYITTDARGVAASKPLPLTRYQIREVTAPAYWQLDPTVHDVTLEYPGQIIKLSAYDKPSSLGVTITKRGNAQVMAGQSMRYDLTVANTSNVPLESFFWHDKIPYDVARPTTLTTGTYSARLNYRILYKTNYNASYQVLASNLLTGNNYSFSLNAIPMQAGEVVTDIYFDFGKVPVGFQSVVNPTLSVMVNGNAVNGYQMVNRADVGGKYQGTWQTAAASWVTIIRRLWNTPTLPKTGY